MRIDVLTIFPEILKGPVSESILQRAQNKGLVEIHIWDLRDFTADKHKVTDDYPYGGGQGMVMKPEPIFHGVERIEDLAGRLRRRILLMTPQGRLFTQEYARQLAFEEHLVLICGRYEGVDERVAQNLATDEVSIGDFILTGGELPALVIIDAVVRLIPGVLGDPESPRQDSFMTGLLEGPQYTRPQTFRGMAVPDVLLSGHHAAIERWRKKESLRRTRLRRPDLLATRSLTIEEKELLDEIEQELAEEGPA